MAQSPQNDDIDDNTVDHWWSPGDTGPFPARTHYPNPYGELGVVNDEGPVDTEGHPFFEALGENGRACVSCHQPMDAMSLSLDTIRERWQETDGSDPIFAAIDGMNCPNLNPDDEASYSLLLNRGLFRIFLPWPPKDEAGQPMVPQFTIEVLRDPTGCNTDARYGLDNPDNPMISVYRRPRPVINMRFVTSDKFGVTPFNLKNGMPNARDPETGDPVNMNIMADAREPTVKTQAQSAARNHLEYVGELTPEVLQQIKDFEMQLYAAQDSHARIGMLHDPEDPHGLGVDAMVNGEDGVLGNNTLHYVFPIDPDWYQPPDSDDAETRERNEFLASVARGHDVFFFRTFWIKDSMHINSVGLGNPIKRTCATCHGAHLTGMDVANGWMDLGTTNLPWATEVPRNPWTEQDPELPLFKLTCKDEYPPHPFLGRVIYTQDPGRALISGRCEDIGSIVIQQLRGLSARLPLFSNGSAQTLEEVIDFYDRRFNIQYTPQERQDLLNFMSTL